MNNFDFKAPTHILFGKGRINELSQQVLAHGTRVLLVYGSGSIKKNGLYQQVTHQLDEAGVFYKEVPGVKPNPRISSVRQGISLCRTHQLDLILAVGGGSTIDASKAMAAGVFYEGDAWDFYIRKAQPKKALPIGTILTLAATGSEMNGATVVNNEETEEKRAFVSPLVVPAFSILDPEVTFSVSRRQTMSGVADIWSHTMEQYFSRVNTAYVSDKLAEGIFKTLIELGPVVVNEPENYTARANIMWASTVALNGLIGLGRDGGDWATHMIEHEVSALYDLTHGIGLAIITPHWMRHVLNNDNVGRFAQYARNVWGITEADDYTAAHQGIEQTASFFRSLGIPATLTDEGIAREKISTMAEKAVLFGDIGGIKKLGKEDVEAILHASY